MKERPILFSAPMVRAILDGNKTQTRRIAKLGKDHRTGCELAACEIAGEVNNGDYCNSHYGEPGDYLWVRETHAIVPRTAYACSDGVQQVHRPDDNHDAAVFREGWTRSAPGRWRPSIHMPRWASRIDLLIMSVRLERLRDFSEHDCLAEGITHDQLPDNQQDRQLARTWYRGLWEQINGAGSWEVNPWVWVVEFERIKPCRT